MGYSMLSSIVVRENTIWIEIYEYRSFRRHKIMRWGNIVHVD
jgi:hypothetical protein